jgi:hypothetical protein
MSAPESFYVFIVGHCEEWPDNRREQGDLALFHEYLDAGVPENQILYIKDGDCTASNCQSQLETFLPGIPSTCGDEKTTFMFYYGGHGISKGFRTLGAIWPYSQVCETINNLFQGERVLFLLDCCDSGNIWEYFPCHSNENDTVKSDKKYVLFANAPPFILASDEGEEWIVTNSWIRGMRCATLPTLTTMMEFLADRLALLLGDQGFGFLFSKTKTEWDPSMDCSWMPKRVDLLSSSREEHLDWPKLQNNIPKEAKANEKCNGGCKPGDSVFYKHNGDSLQASSLQFVPPIWMSGIVIERLDLQEVRLQVCHPAKPLEVFDVVAEKEQLISGLWMAQEWSMSDAFYKTQVHLAKSGKYLHFSALSVGTMVNVQDPDTQKVREANVADWRSFPWKAYIKVAKESHLVLSGTKVDDHDDGDSTSSDEETNASNDVPPSIFSNDVSFGGQIPIRWVDTNEALLVPLAHIVCPDISNVLVRDSSFEEAANDLLHKMESTMSSQTASKDLKPLFRLVLLQAIETNGKSVVNIRQDFGKAVKVYWPNYDKWYAAKTVDKEVADLPLDALASHANFPLPGEYAALLYEDGEVWMSPLYFIRKKGSSICC